MGASVACGVLMERAVYFSNLQDTNMPISAGVRPCPSTSIIYASTFTDSRNTDLARERRGMQHHHRRMHDHLRTSLPLISKHPLPTLIPPPPQLEKARRQLQNDADRHHRGEHHPLQRRERRAHRPPSPPSCSRSA